ncbi:hypothetical protein BDV93DRAFT_449194 [Ceratobasidium sp. AG-I]|nr:hypothetical protein BDV93DRAFT_449194 [Ceratobasidium sp. AG-I]
MRFSTVLGVGASFGVARAAIGTGPHWPGFSALQYMFIFGDSYSTVSWAPSTAPNPTPEQPVGVQWPGVTSVGAFQPNWVGYMTNGFNTSSLLAYDYAISGNNITGFTSQIQTEFVPTAGQKPDATPWTADNSLFVSWIGINDMGENAPIDATIDQIMQQQQNLYALGARNFLLINMPPWDRSPMGTPIAGLGPKILTWNAQLAASALAFSVQNTDTSTLVFPSWDTFTGILNDPSHYNISDPNTIGGGVWKDDLHPTSFMHFRLANDLAGYLVSLPASPSPSSTTASSVGSSSTSAGVGVGTQTSYPAASAVYNPPSGTPSPSSG